MKESTITTTIRVSLKTKDKLIAIGKKDQSFDNIVSSLLLEHFNKRKG